MGSADCSTDSTDEDFNVATKKRVVFDVECYRNYFMVGLRNIDTGNTLIFERYNDELFGIEPDLLKRIIRKCQIIGFNSNTYDLPMVMLALTGVENEKLKKASDRIILRNLKPWDFERTYNIRIPKLDHIDLIEVCPGMASLKIYGGRVHTKRMQDLPIEPDAFIDDQARDGLIKYNGNDLDLTIDVLNAVGKMIDLRVRMSERYEMDLRSKSDAQIAEAVIIHELEKLKGTRIYRPDLPANYSFKYRIPDFIKFSVAGLNHLLEIIRGTTFRLSDKGSVVMPEELSRPVIIEPDGSETPRKRAEDFAIRLGSGLYRLGIGGLHSSEENTCHRAGDGWLLLDRDVASYYPNIILGQRLYPQHLGPDFLVVYGGIVKERLAAKARGDKLTADSLKITVNGSFGKLGSKWSKLYSPDLMVQTTLTGQLALLMLIERLLVLAPDLDVVSANTDGIVIKCRETVYDQAMTILQQWERDTRFETEETRYSALNSRDVNNYMAIKEGGGVKLKGAYTPPGISPVSSTNPTNEICVDAVVAYLTEGQPIEQTIIECRDITKFVTVRTVKGGAVDSSTGQYLGKAIRWIYGKGCTGTINYLTNGNTVPKSLGAYPLMDLPDEFPENLNHKWYIREAYSILAAIGDPRFGGGLSDFI